MAGRRKGVAVLTPLELQIMQVLWSDGASNVQEVQAKLATEPPLAYTTVQTVLNTLERKGKVKRTLKGRAFTYRAAASKDKAMLSLVKDLVEKMFGGSSEDLIMSLIKARQVDPARIAELSRSLSDYASDVEAGKGKTR
jgi:predicted transcriptional regulator